MKDEYKNTYKIFKDAFDALNDYFEEKRSDTITEKIEKAQRDEVALAKFSKGMIGTTNKINFRILIGQEKEVGDHIYEAVYMDDKKDPYIYAFAVNKGRPINNILKGFKEDDWNGYKKVEKFKSLEKFIEYAYKNGVYVKKKKEKKEEALVKLIKGLKRSLEAVEADEKEKSGGSMSPTAKKIAKIVAVTAVTTVASVVLTPAVGVVAQELVGGGQITGGVINQAGQAALEGAQSLADPVNIAKKVVKKAVFKGVPTGND
jgi:hypothetical protein